MFEKKIVFVLIAIFALGLTAAGQKPGGGKATPTPATRGADEGSMDEQAKEFKKQLNSLVKMVDTGFKDVRGEEKPKGSGDFRRRFKTTVTLFQAEVCEITIRSTAKLDSDAAQFVAYYPQVPPPSRRKLYNKLVDAVTDALGPDYTRSHLGDEFSDDPEGKVAFYPKGKTKYVITVSYGGSQSQFNPIKTDVILTIGYGFF